MKSENLFDTITAISTPPGLGGISIIRVSGDKAFDISSKILTPKIKPNTKPRKTILKTIHTIDNKSIDKGLVTIFKKPYSFTGEDMVEISCHGGIAIPNIIIEELIKAGARSALEGEFTKRAFLNNKMDLIQAEAVDEIINAKTKEAVFLAQSNIEKKFSNVLNIIKSNLINILALIEVNVDYPEDELDEVDYNRINKDIYNIKQEISRLISETEKGRAILNGVKVSLVGKTNVGKSSLMNCLLREDRAIVSHIHGTTRDYLDAVIDISGIPVTLIDTAGIRNTDDMVEELGTNKSKKIINESDLILFIIDGTTGITTEDVHIYKLLKNKKKIFLINKIDLIKEFNSKQISDIEKDSDDKTLYISALSKYNIDKLEKLIYNMVININFSITQKEILINTRHKNCLIKIIDYLEICENSIENNISYEFIALDLRKAVDYLGEITGDVSSDDILDNIFKKFCVGK